ncbi:MAG: polyprenyl synthetase family protein [Actinobacteria bacterium]|nr:MAG: polyprenyl synthetase family protein [Actinomycetota bacterium]HMC05159.1 polyprenyl synthetase family protein [Actinomycetota bacterium]
MNVAEVLGLPGLEEDLARLEVTIRRVVTTEDPFLSEVATHLIAAGGKRLRPSLTVASAAAGGADTTEEVLLGAVAVELVHQASLYHDDVMDEATTRRGVQSVNDRWGNLVAIVAGDFLLARAAGIAASLGTEVAGLLASTLARLCEGQVSEVHTAFDVSRSEQAYFATILDKTASLMATACRIGGLTARLDRRQVDALTTFGECFGMVFQIRDDILDVIATEEELGKGVGQDMERGVYTLPVLRSLGDSGVGPELRSLLGRPLDRSQRDKARDMVASSGGIASAVGAGRRYADMAAVAAGTLGSGPTGAALGRLGHALVDDIPTG